MVNYTGFAFAKGHSSHRMGWRQLLRTIIPYHVIIQAQLYGASKPRYPAYSSTLQGRVEVAFSLVAFRVFFVSWIRVVTDDVSHEAI